jgi:hypothetical protein
MTFGFDNYEQFRNYIMNVKYFDIPMVGQMSIIEAISFMTNMLVFPAIFFSNDENMAIKTNHRL